MPGLLPRLDKVLADVREEVVSATQMHRPMCSRHDGWAVIFEELDELWDEIRANNRGPEERAEAIQVAAMGVRYILDLIDE